MPPTPRTTIAALAVFATALAGPWLIDVGPAPPTTPAAPLEGRWRCIAEETDGKPALRWLVGANPLILNVSGDTVSVPQWFDTEGTVTLPGAPANALDIRITIPEDGKELTIPGLYARDGNRLKLCLALRDEPNERPTGFTTRPGDGFTTYTFEKIRPGEVRPETAAEKLGAVIKEALRSESLPADKSDRLAARCLTIAGEHPGTDEAVVCLLWVLANAPDGPHGQAVLAQFKAGRLGDASLDTLAECFGVRCGTIGPGYIPDTIHRELAPLLLERVRRTPDHPKAAEVLSAVRSASWGDDAAEVPAVFDEAARMIADRWTDSPDITHFLETLANLRQRPWAVRYEPVVRAIAAHNPDNYIRCRAAFTLARLVAEAGEARQEEGRELYIRFVADFETVVVDVGVESLARDMVEQARREIAGMLIRGIGGPAPALTGVDLDGRPLALSDYRGKVVLLSFWGSWCGPCLRLVPHERDLLDRFQGRPFAIVGVNGDDMDKFDRTLPAKHGITWPSFRNKRPDQTTITREWNLTAWPELYLIDHTGKIRRHWIGTPPTDEFDHEVARWVAAAEGKPLPPAFRPGQAGVVPVVKGPPAKFLDRVYTDQQGRESKYVICLPDNHDGKTPLPVVLFLHGSGQVGTDNREQLEIGLAPALRKNGMPFPFLGIFPQSPGDDWRADHAPARQALAILAAVERDYPTDPRRIYLTGVSMGGEGVWSLAAAHPDRFAAIVPVCGGGDPKHAATLKPIPCWAFHGDADDIVPVHATRAMIHALTAAGGRPQYQEYRGVGHNCWDRVYADAELYRWLQSQVRP